MCTLAATGLLLHWLVGTLDPTQEVTGVQVVLHLSACIVTAIVLGNIAHAMILAFTVMSVRGVQSIGWVGLAECRDLASWLSFEWNFFGAGGRQEGIRFCGLEVAVQGTR